MREMVEEDIGTVELTSAEWPPMAPWIAAMSPACEVFEIHDWPSYDVLIMGWVSDEIDINDDTKLLV